MEKEKVNFFALQIEDQLNDYIADIKIIEHLPPIQGIIRAQESPDNIDPLENISLKSWQQKLEQFFINHSLARPYYLQLRYIDENGLEMVSVNSTAQWPYVVNPAELQNKAETAYFKEAIKMAPDQTQISALKPKI